MKIFFLSAALAALAAIWWSERLSAARLELEIEARGFEVRRAAAVLRERERLRALEPSAEELAALRRSGTERVQLQAAAERQADRASSTKLDLGDWRPASTWKNCGEATPNAALETMLWAAAGGDVAAVKTLLLIGEDTRLKAEALLAQLPPAVREHYATVDDLIAEYTIKAIPMGSAQLVWFNQPSEHSATVCVFLQQPVPDDATTASGPMEPAISRKETTGQPLRLENERAVAPEREPPRVPDDGQGIETYLSLHREGNGWRLVVPPSAVANFAKQLKGPPAL